MSFNERYTGSATDGRITLPNILPRAAVNYRALVEIRNARGNMEAADDDTIYARILKADGTLLEDRLKSTNAGAALADSTDADWDHVTKGWHEQTATLDTGRYEVFVGITAAAGDEGQYTLEIGWTELGAHNFASRRFGVGDAADLDTVQADTDDIQAKIGTPEAALVSLAAMIGQGDNAVGTDGTAGQSLHSKQRKLLADAAAVLVDTADMQPKLGTPAGASMSADVAAVKAETAAVLVDTGTTLPATLGTPAGASISADIAALQADVTALDAEAGIRKASFTQYPFNANAVLSSDPTDGEVAAAGTATDPGVTPPYEVMHVISIALPETTEGVINSAFLTLKWTGDVTTGAGAGNTKWGVAPYASGNVAGSAPVATVDITDELVESTTKTTHIRSGLLRSSAIPASNGFELVLIGKCAVAAEVLTATIFESTSVEVTYSR